ncbi:MAG TPA: hypothetical protein VFA07_02840 [Chthonomonadaceae bacterium]|nr:hypothetical protein [Chthonomonadaceae bacterium]
MYLTLFMDVEDIIAPDADDIAGTCAEILSEEGVQATLCVVGEKARLLAQRGRQDVIAALNRHDVGVHTDLHSVHPTIAEYLADKGWEDGVEEALRREKPGVEAIRQVFGVMPSCWGGPGNTWGPQICEAMRQLGVPTFVYAYTGVPGGSVHRFAGLLAYPNGRYLHEEVLQDDSLAHGHRERLGRELQEDVKAGIFWQGVFLGHPTRILHEEFWDAPNFAAGANPPREAWIPARRKSQADLDRALVNFREAARFLRSLPGIELRTIREMNARLAAAPAVPLEPDAQEAIWPQMEADLCAMKGWPIHRPDLNLSRIIHLTHDLLPALQRLDTASTSTI